MELTDSKGTRKGVIFDIQRYSVHDGPGIRTLVFLKGCPLRCWWCQNPEGQSFLPELAFDRGKCLGCLACVSVCPQKAIGVSEEGLPVTDRSRCNSCGKCTDVCYPEARFMYGKYMEVSEVICQAERDDVFFRNSGGGITLGGGEPCASPEFAAEILRESRKRGLHTAVETCGEVSWPHLDMVLKNADLVLYDIKASDPGIHEKYTGRRNERIIANLSAIAKDCSTEIIVRIPVIPGVNTPLDEMKGIADMISSVGRISEVHLLPYHNVGEPKYAFLDKHYRLKGLEPPRQEELTSFCDLLLERTGVPVSIGGLGTGHRCENELRGGEDKGERGLYRRLCSYPNR